MYSKMKTSELADKVKADITQTYEEIERLRKEVERLTLLNRELQAANGDLRQALRSIKR
jgi:regulator of replication initiation timing